MNASLLRLCEYESRSVEWEHDTRHAVLAAAEAWGHEHRLPQPPLSFGGPDGQIITAQQYVGVVEAGGVMVEIYPKLDASLVKLPGLIESRADAVMGNLLWLLEESGYGGLVDAGEAAVEESPESITDLLAWLFARRLRHQLSLGMPQEYVNQWDDLSLVRGRIEFARQATVHFGRPDRIACTWDEFTPDTALARLLRCAASLLLKRVRLAGAAADLRDALAMLDDVASVHPQEALSAARSIRWSRMNARWRPCHDLAELVLRGFGRQMHAGTAESFVFLLDMNQLFESYCARWLQRRTGCFIHEQFPLGSLLVGPGRRISQTADFVWQQRDAVWVADAKYKHATRGEWPKIDDVRQLICYGQLAMRLHPGKSSHLMILNPTTGQETTEECHTYDGQRLLLHSVRVLRS